MSGPTAPTSDETWLAQRFDEFVESLLDGDPPRLQEAFAARPELEGRIRESWQLALQVSGRRPMPTLNLPGYSILRELGHGGMAAVFLVRNERLGRTAALKVLPPTLGLSDRARRRFLEEARALAQVEDEHIVRIYDVVERHDLLAYEMEWVDGRSLRQLIDDLRPHGTGASLRELTALLGNGAPPRAGGSRIGYLVQLGIDIARALDRVHAAGLVHRDVKPSNILVRRDGTPLLADFGLAHGTDLPLTQSGAFAGTAVYSSPEQLRGDPESIDARTDVYALGVTLYEALALRMPYQGRDASQVLARIERGELVRLRRLAPEVNRDLETIVHKAMEPDPALRYSSAAAFADDLERLLHLQPIQARPTGPWRRAIKLLRRHRGRLLTALVGAAAGVLLLLGVLLNAQRDELRRQQVAGLVRQARLALLVPEREKWTFGQLARDRTLPQALHAALVPGLVEASRSYQEALELDPAHTEAALERTVVDAVLWRQPDLAVLRERDEMVAEAIQRTTMFANLPDLDADRLASAPPEGRYLIGLLAFLLGNVRVCEQAWDGLDSEGFPIVNAALGLVFLLDRRPELAHARLDRACEVFPEALWLRVKLADAAVSIGDTGRAAALLGDLERAVDLPDAARADVERIRADHLHAVGDTAAARERFESMAVRQPGARTPRFRLAQLDLRTGETQRALGRLRELVAGSPDVARYRRALAAAAWEVGDVGLYLRQARYVVAVDFGAGRSPGTIDDLLAILLDGGLLKLHARGVDRTGHRRPLAEPVHPAVWPVVGPLPARDQIEAALGRLVAFDRHHARAFPNHLPRGPGRGIAEAMAIASEVTLRFPEPFCVVDRGAAFVSCWVAGGCRAFWPVVTGRILPTLSAWTRHVVATGWGAGRSLHVLEGSDRGDAFGCWGGLALLPDIDGDGCAEILVGAPGLGRTPAAPGYVRVYSGRDGHVLYEFHGDAPGDAFGWSVDSAGDVDADGCADIIVSGRLGGYAEVFSGRTGEQIRRFEGPAGQKFGWIVAGVGDLDADGHADVLVTELTANGWAGGVWLYSGRTGEQLCPPLSGSALEAFGACACGLGDLDRDGVPDIAVSAPASAVEGLRSGRIEVFSGRWLVERTGPRTIWVRHGEPPVGDEVFGARLGQRVACAGDVDRDGCPDLIAGANAANDGAGYARVYSGRTGETLWTFSGLPGDGLGNSVAGAGDVDRDGHADLLAAGIDVTAGVRGAAGLFSGRTGELLDRWHGTGVLDALVAVSGGRDVDGDGDPDILMGASQHFGEGPRPAGGPGYVWICSGR